jgi:hypothetical protein
MSDNSKPPRGRMPSAHDIAEALIEEISHSGLDRSTPDRISDPDADTPVDIPRRASYTSAPPELRWLERRIGKSVLWGLKAIYTSIVIFVGSAVGSMLWSWLTSKH